MLCLLLAAGPICLVIETLRENKRKIYVVLLGSSKARRIQLSERQSESIPPQQLSCSREPRGNLCLESDPLALGDLDYIM